MISIPVGRVWTGGNGKRVWFSNVRVVCVEETTVGNAVVSLAGKTETIELAETFDEVLKRVRPRLYEKGEQE